MYFRKMVRIVKQNGTEINLAEMRGKVIDMHNEINATIDDIVIDFFQVGVYDLFRKLVLNTSIMDSGSKIKILNNLVYSPRNFIQNLRRLNAIRNAFAHANFGLLITVKSLPTTQKESIEFSPVLGLELNYLDSQGKYKTDSAEHLYDEFEKLYSELKAELKKICIEKPYRKDP